MKRLVLIRWIDAVSQAKSGWKEHEQFKKQTPAVIESVGWVVHETAKWITLVASKDGFHADGDVLIPKGCIVHMETLRRSKGEKPK